MAENGIDMAANLQTQLAALCEAEGYDLVLIDSGPGDVPLLDTYLSTANYLLIPTRDDQASLGGVERLARRFWRARNRGASIELLGVLLFDVNPRATKRNEEVFAQVSEMLEGSGTTPFDLTIRSAPAAAVDMRNLHRTAGELVALANDDRRSRLAKLRDKKSPERALWTSDPSGLAADYQELVRQIVARLRRYESAPVRGACRMTPSRQKAKPVFDPSALDDDLDDLWPAPNARVQPAEPASPPAERATPASARPTAAAREPARRADCRTPPRHGPTSELPASAPAPQPVRTPARPAPAAVSKPVAPVPAITASPDDASPP